MTHPARLRLIPLVATVITVALVTLTGAPATATAASDKQLARAGVIVRGDVPSTWTSSPDADDADAELEAAAKTIPSCTTYLSVRKANRGAANAESLDFTDGANELSNEVWVFRRAGKAKKVFSDMMSSNIAPCFTTMFQQLFTAEVADDPSVLGVQVMIDPSTNLPGLAGDETIAYGGPLLVTNTDRTVDRLLLANFLARQGRSILSFSVLGPPDAQGNFASPFAQEAETAINGAIERMAKAL